MSSDTFEKALSTVLITVSLASATALAITHTSVPDYVGIIYGVVVGYATHALGVVSGAAAVTGAFKNGVVK